ncbi:hypothetical protein PsorP6_016677 [Peronosclerospora sorghi]|uniref:Uncharacterized protein n=1 Tax=Peronosclerospora sorghi TaxID=230839 RepID=A0ACC0VNF1_9STRA|nr:hypothetical protein PsorP6_016677 [Peronosclerospora sorghi]
MHPTDHLIEGGMTNLDVRFEERSEVRIPSTIDDDLLDIVNSLYNEPHPDDGEDSSQSEHEDNREKEQDNNSDEVVEQADQANPRDEDAEGQQADKECNNADMEESTPVHVKRYGQHAPLVVEFKCTNHNHKLTDDDDIEVFAVNRAALEDELKHVMNEIQAGVPPPNMLNSMEKAFRGPR